MEVCVVCCRGISNMSTKDRKDWTKEEARNKTPPDTWMCVLCVLSGAGILPTVVSLA